MTAVAKSSAVARQGGPLRSDKPRGVVLNRKLLRTVREVALDHYDAEYLYLRENELTSFDADVKLDYLRVLDLSINDIGGAVDFLERVPRLHHLYMTGNKIDTLVGLSNLSTLETICLSDNAIGSFEGLENLPNLRVLSLNFNNITSFDFYPKLPALHTLNLVGNPITEVPSYRSMAIAINNPGLVSIDGNPIQEEERVAVEHYQGKISYCVRNGFIVEGEEVEAAASAFLTKLQRQRAVSRCLQLCAIRLAPAAAAEGETTEASAAMPTEGVPLTLSLCMQDIRPYAQRTTDIFHSSHLYPVIFKVSGEATEVFVVGSMNNWTDPIELERCEEEEDGEVYFHTTLYLPAGDYEYRYIVDGVEKVSDTNRITSKYKQGFCNLYQVNKLDVPEDNQDTLLYIRWMRSNQDGNFEVIEDETALTYVPRTADVGCCLRAEVLAYINATFSFLYFDISSPVVANAPSCTSLVLKGRCVEGAVLTAEAEYAGGVEGNSSLTWYRVLPSGEERPLDPRDPWAGYKLCKDDIGCRIRAVFTPVRSDWVAGEAKSVTSGEVVAGPPECVSIKIIGTLMEGRQLECVVVYAGGAEGASVYQWLRGVDGTEDYIPIEDENGTTYVPTLADVGKCLAVEFTPVNALGKEGETCRCVLENPIEPAEPEVRQLVISGKMQEQHVLTLEFEYVGGHPGQHLIQWYSRHEGSGRLSKIGEANSEFLTLTAQEVGCNIEVSLTPVRDDKVAGKTVHAAATGTVGGVTAVVTALNVMGEPQVGQELILEAETEGTDELQSRIEWQFEDPATDNFCTVAENVTVYTIPPEAAGRLLKVTYTPVSHEGEVGHAKSRIVRVADVRLSTPPAAAQEPTPIEAPQTPVQTEEEAMHTDPNANLEAQPPAETAAEQPAEETTEQPVEETAEQPAEETAGAAVAEQQEAALAEAAAPAEEQPSAPAPPAAGEAEQAAEFPTEVPFNPTTTPPGEENSDATAPQPASATSNIH